MKYFIYIEIFSFVNKNIYNIYIKPIMFCNKRYFLLQGGLKPSDGFHWLLQDTELSPFFLWTKIHMTVIKALEKKVR